MAFRPLSRALPLRTFTRAFSSTPSNPLAKITLIGRLAAEPELTSTSTGQDLVKYSIATNYGPPDNRQTSWWRVVSFAEEGKGRERLLGLGKSTLVYIEGHASMRKFENKDGKTESSLSIVQDKLEVLKRPESQQSAEPTPEEQIAVE